ncbi:energy transducer TonB [Lysobacter niastensis]|nr:energy transducer TonB [Lysobacter niastensis]
MAFAISHPQAGALRFPESPLDLPRIVGQAGAIVINAALLMALMVPLNVPMQQILHEPELEAVFIEPKKVEPKPVEIVHDKPRPLPPAPSQRTEAVRPVRADAVVPAQPDDLVAPLQPDVADAFDDSLARVEPPSDGLASTAAQLQALVSPAPPYPAQAIRDGLTGTVVLEIVVGTDGRPLDVTIVRSSGHRVLDQAARRTVLTRWTFQAATRYGQPVQAIGRVPIDFVLQR